jgi:hypothetical protein
MSPPTASFASFNTGVLAFECIFYSLISDAVSSLRVTSSRCFLGHFDLQSDPKRLDNTHAFIIKRTDANR